MTRRRRWSTEDDEAVRSRVKLDIPPNVQSEIDAGALFVINHSAGKDSQAMTALLSSVLPAHQVLVVHAELPEADWPGLAEHIMATVPPGWTIRNCRAGKTFFDMVERRFAKRPEVPAFPSPSNRQCTSDLKRDPIAKVVRQHLALHPEFGARAVICMGLRAEESASRAKAPVWKLNKRESKAGRTVHEWLPIHDLLVGEVFDVIASVGQEPHWAYAAGMSRLSCSFCIMANKADLRTAASLRPTLARRYIELEKRTGYTMSMARIPLSEICGIS